MKISHVTSMALLAASTLISQALSLPHWGNHSTTHWSNHSTTHWSNQSDTRLAKRASRVAYAGINIPGCEFGININGTSTGSSVCPSLVGPTQMQHFTMNDKLNLFRLPVGWQYLVNNNLGGPLDQTFFNTYNGIVQACLATGALCILDVHNYARWNGGIIGQGGPTNEQFASLWAQLARKYASQSNVIFGLMNEPHDLNMTIWAASVQYTIDAVRHNGATSQMILLPGTNYDAVGGFQTTSAPALSSIRDYDGSTDRLIYEAHQYLDNAGGSSTECVTDGIEYQLSPLTDYLRSVNRKAILDETGGGNTASCITDVCAELTFLNENSDVWLGWAGWAAGSFDSTYTLTETPNGTHDTSLVSACIAGKFDNPP